MDLSSVKFGNAWIVRKVELRPSADGSPVVRERESYWTGDAWTDNRRLAEKFKSEVEANDALGPLRVRRLQIKFTLRGMLWATFWMAMWMAGLASFRVFEEINNTWLGVVSAVVCPFAAVGALFGRTERGVAVGVCVLILLFFVLLRIGGLPGAHYR